ncbi:hypothetical protein S245_003439, partial [Arachis hypogaea]
MIQHYFPVIQTTSCKSTISSLILSSFSNETTTNKNKSTFRGLGCAAASASSQQVSVPAAIRSSADWKNTRKNKKCRRRNTEKSSITCDHKHASSSFSSSFQDVWCGPGIGFASDHASASVNCVVARKNASSRRSLDAVERATHREKNKCYSIWIRNANIFYFVLSTVVVAIAVANPTDLVKVRLQAEGKLPVILEKVALFWPNKLRVVEEKRQEVEARARELDKQLKKQSSCLALLLSCFGGAYALLPYFILWNPPAPPIEETELKSWPLIFLESKVTAV